MEIEVTPAGKSTRKLSLLSGGEKSLVALAFVFAVFLARPCPFYILDEVEAALDDANIDRFLQLIRRFSDRAQFVIVTHQKRTMDAADVLYGVSMGGDGVTKVVSRRLPREDEKAGEDRRVVRRRLSLSTLSPGEEELMAQRHMDRLTSFDTSFLSNERSNGHMAIGAVLVCAGHTARATRTSSPTSAAGCTSCPVSPAARLPAAAAWARRSGSTTPTSTSPTTCAASTLPAPGTDAQFHELVARDPFAAARPLAPPLGAVAGRGLRRASLRRRSTRPTTPSPTASRRSTSARSSSTSSRDSKSRCARRCRGSPGSTSVAGRASRLRASRGSGRRWRRMVRWIGAALRQPSRAAKRAADGAVGL